MFLRLCTRFSNTYGIPKKFLEAMKFEVGNAEQHSRDLRIFTNSVSDRLSAEDIKGFVTELEKLRDRRESIPHSQLKGHIFKLFNSFQILDLVPLILKVDLSKISSEVFTDEFDSLTQSLQLKTKSILVNNKLAESVPKTLSLLEQISYQFQYSFLPPQETPKQANDHELISFLQQENQNEEQEQQNLSELMEQYRQKRFLKKNLAKKVESSITPGSEHRSLPLRLKQQQSQNTFVPSKTICVYGLPYTIDEAFRNEFQQRMEIFGKVDNIRYFEYSKFKEVKLNATETDLDKYIYTDRILERIQRNKNKKLFQSYAVLDFQNISSKLECLHTDMRVFGMKFQDLSLRMDDADHKKTLFLTGLKRDEPVEKTLQVLQDKLNIKFIPQDKRSQLENETVTLVMNSFAETMQVFDTLKDSKLFHFPDGLRVFQGKYFEQIDISASLETLNRKRETIISECQVNYDIKDDIDIDLDELELPQPIQPQSIQYDVSSDEEDFEMVDSIWDEEYFK